VFPDLCVSHGANRLGGLQHDLITSNAAPEFAVEGVVRGSVFNVILKHCTIFQKHIDDMVLLPELVAMSKFQGYQCIGTSRRMASSSDVCLLDERPTATSQHHHVAQLKRIETD